MSARVRLVAWLVVIGLAVPALARADPSLSGPVLVRAIEREARRLSRVDGAGREQSSPLGQRLTDFELKRCDSEKKGLLVGAIIGAVAGGAVAVYATGAVSGSVLGASHGAPAVIVYLTAIGAAGGALGGWLYCR